MGAAFHVGRPVGNALQVAGPVQALLARIDHHVPHRERLKRLLAPDHLHLAAVGIGEADPLAAARLIQVFHRRRPLGFGEGVQVFFRRGMECDADEPGSPNSVT